VLVVSKFSHGSLELAISKLQHVVLTFGKMKGLRELDFHDEM